MSVTRWEDLRGFDVVAADDYDALLRAGAKLADRAERLEQNPLANCLPQFRLPVQDSVAEWRELTTESEGAARVGGNRDASSRIALAPSRPGEARDGRTPQREDLRRLRNNYDADQRYIRELEKLLDPDRIALAVIRSATPL